MAIDAWADTVQTVAVVLAAGGAAFAWRQVRISRHGGGQANALALWALLMDEKSRSQRRVVMEAFERAGSFDATVSNWSDVDREAGVYVASMWSMAATLGIRDAIPLDLLKDEWGQSIKRYWVATSGLVLFERARRGDPRLWRNFEVMANQM